jgi:hypothetical protein
MESYREGEERIFTNGFIIAFHIDEQSFLVTEMIVILNLVIYFDREQVGLREYLLASFHLLPFCFMLFRLFLLSTSAAV